MVRRLILGLLAAGLLGGCVAAVPTAPLALDSGAEIDTLQPFEMAARALARRYGSDRVLVVYDVDNTLLASRVPLGSDQWFDWQADGAPQGVAVAGDFDCLLAAQGVLFHLGSMRLTHPGVAFAVGRLQDEGYPSLVLTSRGPEFALATQRELARNGLDFARQPLPRAAALASAASAGELAHGTWLPYVPGQVSGFSAAEIERFRLDASGNRPRPVRYDRGVFFTSGQHKGAMLRILLARLGLSERIAAVVFADDKRRHVEAMTDALTAAGKEVAAYHYRAERGAVTAFNDDVDDVRQATDAQWCSVAATLPVLRDALGADNYAGSRFEACVVDWLARCPSGAD
jgi:hypothetical protein